MIATCFGRAALSILLKILMLEKKNILHLKIIIS
jgi:hypothetical protein